MGIDVGSISATGTLKIEKNMVSRVRNNNGATWPAFGINLGGGNNHVVQNNFVFDVRNDQTTGTGAFSTTFRRGWYQGWHRHRPQDLSQLG